jgi:hypothetical protein
MRALAVSPTSPNGLDLLQHIALVAAGVGLAYRFALAYGHHLLALPRSASSAIRWS